jgi:hypothetical protein
MTDVGEEVTAGVEAFDFSEDSKPRSFAERLFTRGIPADRRLL